jgi:hypothetical protein
MKNTNAYRFHHFCCCAAETTSSRSSICICDRESRSPESSSSTILHQERTNKVFEKRSSRLLARFVKFFIMTRLPLRQSRAEGRRLQCELHQVNCHHQGTASHVWFCSQIVSYIFSVLIYVDMILLDTLLQYLLFITMISI